MDIISAGKKHISQMQQLNLQLGYETDTDFLTNKLKDPKTLIYLAVINQKIVGMVGGIIFDYFHCPTRIARLDALIIDENYRRHGIGHALLNYFELESKKNNCTFVELSSSLERVKGGTYDFYEKNNYLNQADYGITYFRKNL